MKQISLEHRPPKQGERGSDRRATTPINAPFYGKSMPIVWGVGLGFQGDPV